MSEWKEYEGTDEQIEEMRNAEHGFIVKDVNGEVLKTILKALPSDFKITHYLICNPHPLAGMIERQARTGQPVYWRYEETGQTGCTPDHNVDWSRYDEFEYSFTPFEEGK